MARISRNALVVLLGAAPPLVGSSTATPVQQQASLALRSEMSPLERRARLHVSQGTLLASLIELQERSGASLVFSPSRLPKRVVSCDCGDLSVGLALERLLAGTELVFGVVGKHILIEPDPERSSPADAAAPLSLVFASSSRARSLGTFQLPTLPAAEDTLTGHVVDQRGRPVPGARVTVVGSALAATTDAQGRFTLATGSGDVTLRVTAIGYSPLTHTAAARTTDVRLVVSELAVKLEEVVVTGTVGEARTRAIGNSVGRVAAEELVEISPPADLQQMLSPQVAGLRTIKGQGEVGTGGVTRIRGTGSLSLQAEPLIYVDGVRVDNSQVQRGVVFFRTAPSRWNDFNPEDIESIEVIKGPAAATLYGTEASNGVIQIITKKGREGAPTVDVSVKQGANWLRSPETVYPDTWYLDAGQPTSFNVLASEKALGNNPFAMGHPHSYGLSARGGAPTIQYFLSAEYDRDEGIVDYNWINRWGGRANLTFRPSEKFDITGSLGLIQHKLRSATVLQTLSTAIIFSSGSLLNTRTRGYRNWLPEDLAVIEGTEEVDRTTLSFQFAHRPAAWLNHRLTFGGDIGNGRQAVLVPRDPLGSAGPLGGLSLGAKTILHTRANYLTADYAANATYPLRAGLTGTTSAGVQYYSKRYQLEGASGSVFPVPGIETVSGASTRSGSESFIENKTLGVFAQQQIALNDRLFLTGAVRGDDNSAFGTDFDFVLYPKLSASWVISEERFWNIGAVNTLKLRAAWGKAGQQPDAFAAVRLYAPDVGAGGAAGVVPDNFGNPDLEPEVGQEIELGFDAGLFNDSLSLEATYYDKRTKNAIVPTPSLPSLGFPGVRFVNLGEVGNKGIELAMRARLLDRERFGWDVGGKFSTNSNEIIDLGGLPPVVIQAAPLQMHVEGMPVGALYMKRVLSAEFDGNGAVINAMCEGGDPIKGGGGPVPCGQAGLAYFGRVTPKWEGSVNTEVQIFRDLRLYALADFVGGFHMVSGDVWGANNVFRLSEASVKRNDPILEAYNAMGLSHQTGTFNAGFAKLRVVSASYQLPRRWLRAFGVSRASFTLSGENLGTLWVAQRSVFGHRVIDPELRTTTTVPGAAIGATGAAGALDAYTQTQLPQFTRFSATLRVTF